MKILTQAASSLDTNMPESDFKREMNRVKSVMEGIKSKGTVEEPAKNDAIEKLKKAAASGNTKAQSALKKAGIAWQ